MLTVPGNFTTFATKELTPGCIVKRLSISLLGAALATVSSLAAETEPRSVWGHSCYTYKDMNRNGIFDMGDKPYSGLRLEVTRPDGSVTWRDSNVDGFANLNAAFGIANEHVPYAGLYKVRAIYPDGWQSLSDMDRQELEFVRRDNAGGRLVPKATCRPIGVAPILRVSGKVDLMGAAPDDLVVTLVSRADQSSLPLTLDRGGNFTSIARQGEWRILVADKGGATLYQRDFRIEHGAVRLSTINLQTQGAPELDAAYDQLDFDGLVLDSLFEIPAGYGGLKWLNWIAVHNRFYEGGGYINNTVSSEFVAYNSSGVPGPIWSDKPFDFKGVYIGVAWPRGEEDEVVIIARRGDELVYEDRLMLTDNGPVWFDAAYEDITFLEISHGNYERIVLDNFQYKFD